MRLGKLNKNKGYNYYLFLIGIVFFSLCGCKSSKELQTNLRNNVVSLGYELRTEPVMNENKNVVVLREIGPVFMDYQTVAKRKKFILVPLFFFNYSRTDFKVTLGEFSLEEPFKNFFANALYTQSDCNGNFYLQPNLPDEVNDSVYIVEIDFKNINTHGRINCVDNAILWFDDDLNFGNDFMEYKSNRIKDVESYIELELIVYRGAKCVHRKRFKNKYKYPKQVKVIDDISLSYSPMQMMGITLSLNTRDIVEEIVQEINLIIESNLQVLKQP